MNTVSNTAYQIIIKNKSIEAFLAGLPVPAKTKKWARLLNKTGYYTYATGFGISDELAEIIIKHDRQLYHEGI